MLKQNRIQVVLLLFLQTIFTPLINAEEEAQFNPNPVIAKVGEREVRLEDVRNKKIYDLSLQLHRQLESQLIEYSLQQLQGAHPEINLNPKITISEKQIATVYRVNNLKNRGTLEEFREQIRNFLTEQLRREQLLAQYGLAIEKGWVTSYLKPPSEFVMTASVKTAFLRGNTEAGVMVLEFSDYQCPYCKRIQSTIQKLVEKYQERVAFGYRHFPLSFHTEADEAAIAAECAREQGKFMEMHEMLYAYQKGQSIKELKRYARQIMLKNPKKFDECLDTERYREQVDQDIEDGSALGITGTPGFFIGSYNTKTRQVEGEVLSGAQPISAFESMINKYLKRQ